MVGLEICCPDYSVFTSHRGAGEGLFMMEDLKEKLTACCSVILCEICPVAAQKISLFRSYD